MSRWLLCLLALGLAGGAMAQIPASSGLRQPEFIPGQYIVLLKDGAQAPRPAAAALAQRFGLRVGFVYHTALRGFACRATEAAARTLARDPAVAAVVPDIRVHACAQTLPTGVNRVEADLLTASDPIQIDGVDDQPDVDIAIIDTGVGPHKDLRLVGGVDFSGSGSYLDGNGHGTHVAGIAAAVDNTDGVVGVCPGARVWSVRVLGPDGSGSVSAVAAGVDWVASRGDIEVANMSLGAYWPEIYTLLFGDPLEDAVRNASAAGVHFAVAAGNESADAVDNIPARYPQVVCASALDDRDGATSGDDRFASFSNFGSVVDVIAPGVLINSTTPNDTYATYSGTSMASPHAAGAIAVYLLAHPGTSPADVLNTFRNNGEPAPAGGWPGDPDGIAERAVNLPLLLSQAPPLPPPPSTFDFTVAVSTNRASYKRGQSVYIYIQATDTQGNPVAGAPVVASVTDSRGRTQSTTGITDDTGLDIFLLLTSRRDPPGTWTARGQVTASGLTRAGQTTFQVR
ncbi:MAG: S8 family serine peptidase [Armatimonadetes bacterium]|nr:S8 family serine peptidase [Armatimonadota bacterium]